MRFCHRVWVMVISLKSESRSRAVNHEGTKGGEGKVKTFISNQSTQFIYIALEFYLSFIV